MAVSLLFSLPIENIADQVSKTLQQCRQCLDNVQTLLATQFPTLQSPTAPSGATRFPVVPGSPAFPKVSSSPVTPASPLPPNGFHSSQIAFPSVPTSQPLSASMPTSFPSPPLAHSSSSSPINFPHVTSTQPTSSPLPDRPAPDVTAPQLILVPGVDKELSADVINSLQVCDFNQFCFCLFVVFFFFCFFFCFFF